MSQLYQWCTKSQMNLLNGKDYFCPFASLKKIDKHKYNVHANTPKIKTV